MPNQYSATRFTWLVATIQNHDSDECLVWPFGKIPDGYGTVKHNKKDVLVHRVAFWLANGHWPTPEGLHLCDVRACFNPRHIIEGTQANNMSDCANKNRNVFGSRSRTAKLTDEIVRQIRKEYVPHRNGCSRLAVKYGVTRRSIYSVISGQSWKRVT